jgi:hypothetical protein
LDFDFNADTNATLKAIGGGWDKPAKVWTLPVSRLDKLIARCGDELMCDTEVWLAAPVKRSPCPGKCPACNVMWVYRDATGWEPGCRCSCVPVGSVRYDPVPLTGKAADVAPTRFDTLLADGLPRWAANQEREKARNAQRRY